ncbi:MAG TPA: gfo/Idh/MocA family oxidoreductase, partial [Methylomirabilota bacterium]|nr:gfo/Idh/MocA family oxidoreductase [Methylomirabilota bacterium]
MSNRVHIGIVGTGFVQNACHMPAYSEVNLANVVAVAGGHEARDFASRWNIRKVYEGDDAI